MIETDIKNELSYKYQVLLDHVKSTAWIGMEKEELKKIVKNKTDGNNDFASRYILCAEKAITAQEVLKLIGELK